MSLDKFHQRKQSSAVDSDCKEDKSLKGSIDEHILSVCNLLNRHADYFTTSSCSGRIVLWDETKKKWLYVSHDRVDNPSVLVKTLEERGLEHLESVYVKMEPVILHVQCRGLVSAQRLCLAVLAAGFRNSGMTVNAEGDRWQVAIRCTLKLDAPLMHVDNVGTLIGICNGKMALNMAMIERLRAALLVILAGDSQSALSAGAN